MRVCLSQLIVYDAKFFSIALHVEESMVVQGGDVIERRDEEGAENT